MSGIDSFRKFTCPWCLKDKEANYYVEVKIVGGRGRDTRTLIFCSPECAVNWLKTFGPLIWHDC